MEEVSDMEGKEDVLGGTVAYLFVLLGYDLGGGWRVRFLSNRK